jgi:hypothetical protein
MERRLLTGALSEKFSLFYQEILFIRDSEKYVKEGSRNGQISPQGSRWWTLEEVRFSAERHLAWNQPFYDIYLYPFNKVRINCIQQVKHALFYLFYAILNCNCFINILRTFVS